MHLLLLCVASGSSSRTITCYVCEICTHGIVVVLYLWLWLAVLRFAWGSCENASVFDKSNGIFYCKTKLLPLYRINSRGKGNEFDILLSCLCFMGPMTHAVSADEFYFRVLWGRESWITVATVDRTCIAYL